MLIILWDFFTNDCQYFVVIFFAIYFLGPLFCYSPPILFGYVWPVSPEFCYRPGLSAVSEDGGGGAGGGAPTRPLPPTPDDDDTHGDRTLVMKRVSPVNCFNTTFYIMLSESRHTIILYYLTYITVLEGEPRSMALFLYSYK